MDQQTITQFIAAQKAHDAEYLKWREHARGYERLVHARIERLMQQAGLGSSYHGCIVHNAYLAASEGHPWAGTDPALVRQIHYLDEERRWRAHTLLEGWHRRKWQAIREAYLN